jgi:hypothetical protein
MATEGATRGQKFTPTQATILVAVIGALSAALVAVVSETIKSSAQIRLAKSEFETKLIFRAIEGSSTEEERARNLNFFLKAGFLSDPDGRIAALSPSQFPSKSAFDRIVPNLESPNTAERRAARFELGVGGAEAIPFIIQLLEKNPDPKKSNYFQVLGAIQALAIMAPKYRCAAYGTNPKLRQYVEMHATDEETLSAAIANALLCPL